MIRKLIAAFLLAICAPVGWAVIVYSNFGVGDTYDVSAWLIGLPGVELRRAVRFTPTFNGTFTSLRVPVQHESGTNSYVVSLAADNAGLPGADIETFSGVVFPAAAGIITLTSVANPLLLAGGNYWVVMRAPDPVTAGSIWYVNNQALLGSYRYGFFLPLAWTFQSDGNTPAYEVNATAASVCSLDFSGDNLLDATDGLLLTRWLLGLRDEALVAGIALVPQSTTAAEFAAAVTTRMNALTVAVHDFDGNGAINATTDALILTRILRDVRSDAALTGALGIGATRSTYISVRDHLNNVCAAGITP